MLDNRLGLFDSLHFKLFLFSLHSLFVGIPLSVGFPELGFKKPRTLEELILVIVLLCLHILPLHIRMFTLGFWNLHIGMVLNEEKQAKLAGILTRRQGVS